MFISLPPGVYYTGSSESFNRRTEVKEQKNVSRTEGLYY